MKRVLAFDPGWTTGIAVFDSNGEFDFAITATSVRVQGNSFFNKLVAMAQPDIILIESLPTKNVDQKTLELHLTIRNWFRVAGYEVVEIKPSQWKGMVERVEIPGQHTRDAATMARWFIKTMENK